MMSAMPLVLSTPKCSRGNRHGVAADGSGRQPQDRQDRRRPSPQTLRGLLRANVPWFAGFSQRLPRPASRRRRSRSGPASCRGRLPGTTGRVDFDFAATKHALGACPALPSVHRRGVLFRLRRFFAHCPGASSYRAPFGCCPKLPWCGIPGRQFPIPVMMSQTVARHA
jgi:hypothetical protein